jgi:hypothetical protein
VCLDLTTKKASPFLQKNRKKYLINTKREFDLFRRAEMKRKQKIPEEISADQVSEEQVKM